MTLQNAKVIRGHFENPERKKRPPLMEEDWIVLCQALYQSTSEEEWNELHEMSKEDSQNIWIKKAGREEAGLGKLAWRGSLREKYDPPKKSKFKLVTGDCLCVYWIKLKLRV